MMKKILIFLILIVFSLGILIFTSCGENETPDDPNAPTKCEHEEKIIPAVAATCTNVGKTEGKKCSVCDEVLLAQSDIPATGIHNYGANDKCTSCGACIVYTAGLEFTPINDGSEYEVSDIGSATDVNIIIPKEYAEKPVTSIGEYAFAQRDILSVTIPNTVTKINNDAFSHCKHLLSVTIPESVNYIDAGAFALCESLTDVYISDIEKWCEIDINPNYASPFSYAKNLYLNGELTTEIVIPDGITEIKPYTFYNFKTVTSIKMPDSVKIINRSAFKDATGLKSLHIPKEAYINRYAFTGCSGLLSITVDENNPDFRAEGNCLLYKSSDVLLLGCQTSVIPEGVTSILEPGFSGCTNLTSITLPESLSNIENFTFQNCINLTSITIPKNVKTINTHSFIGCDSLTSITVDEANTTYYSEGNCIIESETNELVVGCRSSVIPSSVTSIGEYAFNECTLLTSITIPASVTLINRYAFYCCEDLLKVTLENGTFEINDEAFYGCPNMVEVYNKSILNIEAGSESNGGLGLCALNIYSQESESKLDFRDDGYIFYDDGESVYLMGYGKNADELVLPEGYGERAYKIYKYAFSKFSTIKSLKIGEGVESIGFAAFAFCTNLTSVTISKGVEMIDCIAFRLCTSLTSIIFEGTLAEWNSIEKEVGWNDFSAVYTVYCTDGEIKKH